MKKIMFSCMFLIFFITNANIITEFQRDLIIQNNGSILVKEKIKLNFSERKHGIYRNIETGDILYVSNPIVLHNDIISQFSKENFSSGVYTLKIGDPNKYLDNGIQKYEISYILEGAVFLKNNKKYVVTNLFRYWDYPVENFTATISYEDGTILNIRDFDIKNTYGSETLYSRQEGNKIEITGKMLSKTITDFKVEINNSNVKNVNVDFSKKTQEDKANDMPLIIFGTLVLGFLLLIIGHVYSKNEDNNDDSNKTTSTYHYNSNDFEDDFSGGSFSGGGFSGGGGW